jgi:CDGSH-type Zn-finger protein
MDQPKRATDNPIPLAVEAGKVYSWCACGHSQTQPLCDHSHRTAGTTLKSVKWTATETKTVFLCGCKQTKNAPFCDGSHSE